MIKTSTTNSKLIERIKVNEGTLEYQTFLGYFSDGKFIKYKCTEGFWTIGYGHRCLDTQEPITKQEAELLLIEDVKKAEQQALSVHKSLYQEVNDVLTEMVFQLGKSGVLKFKRFLIALEVNDFKKAAYELMDSKYFKQTPNRVQRHIKVLNELQHLINSK
jgi:lysozyme